MTRTPTDTVKVHAYGLMARWYRLGAWSQIFIAAGLLCVLELLVFWRMYPWLVGLVTS